MCLPLNIHFYVYMSICLYVYIHTFYGVTQYLLNQLKNIIFEMNFAGKYSVAYISLLIPDKHLFLLNSLSILRIAIFVATSTLPYTQLIPNTEMKICGPKWQWQYGNTNDILMIMKLATLERTHSHFMNNIYGLCSNSLHNLRCLDAFSWKFI